MKAKLLVSTAFLAASVSLSAQKSATITVHADQGKEIIPKEIYGQFAEHLGSCIYGGLWVGENSDIPNIKGYRTDVFNALKDLSVPVLRWPGGCFARRRVVKSAVKVWGSTLKLQLILASLSAVEVCGIRGVAVKCLDITKNSDCEGSTLSRN